MLIAPLFAAPVPNASAARRFAYRATWRDAHGHEVQVLVGDDVAVAKGIPWLRHGSTVTFLQHQWLVYLDHNFR